MCAILRLREPFKLLLYLSDNCLCLYAISLVSMELDCAIQVESSKVKKC